MKTLTLTLVLATLTLMSLDSSDGHRILGVFPFHGRSHFMMFEALMKGLARKGHQVDVISSFAQKKPYPNYTDLIELPLMRPGFVNNMTYEDFHSLASSIVHFIADECGNKICNNLGHPSMLKLIRDPPKDPPYDLLITEIFGAHCFMALGPHLKIPTIGISSSALYPWGHGIIGNPANLAFVPNNLLNYNAPMSFWERIHNTVHAIGSDYLFQYYSRPQDDLIKKYLGENAMGLRDSERNLALVFTNTHPALNGPRPITPAVIEVGGLHVQDDESILSQDLKQWMDDSKDGFIYFTFGSMVTIESFPRENIEVFYKSLGKLAPIRVLIKIPDPTKLPPGMPKNFRTFVWAPQYKVLKHKNIKAFITHGGLMGTQEAIHCAVPMIGMPLFADQFVNIDVYARKNMAVKLFHKGITEEKMDAALNEILYNPLYKNTVTEVSRKFLDRPMTSMETAIWWVEYVIRNGGGSTLKSPALDLAWWQVDLLDVYGTLLLLAILTIFVAIVLVQLFLNIFFIVRSPKAKDTKKTN